MGNDNCGMVTNDDVWQPEEHPHSVLNGRFLPEDVARVLGNPWDSVQVSAEAPIGYHHLTAGDAARIFAES